MYENIYNIKNIHYRRGAPAPLLLFSNVWRTPCFRSGVAAALTPLPSGGGRGNLDPSATHLLIRVIELVYIIYTKASIVFTNECNEDLILGDCRGTIYELNCLRGFWNQNVKVPRF